MTLKQFWGCYSPGMTLMVGGFQLNGSSPPTVLRDGTMVASAKKMFTVTRVSAGLYEVDFIAGYPLPILPFVIPVLQQAAPATTKCTIHEVKSTWNPTTGNRKVRFQIESVTTTPLASDGDAGDRVVFAILGSFEGPGIDPA